MSKKNRKGFIIEYLRIFLSISVFSPGFYLAIKTHENESLFLLVLTLIALISGAAILIKLPEVMGDPKTYPK
ncbi:MAG: hypothetical protein ACNA8K_17155 [Cyclonatronaceae bacterium]